MASLVPRLSRSRYNKHGRQTGEWNSANVYRSRQGFSVASFGPLAWSGKNIFLTPLIPQPGSLSLVSIARISNGFFFLGSEGSTLCSFVKSSTTEQKI